MATLIAGIVAGVGAVVGSLVSLLSGVLNRRSQALYRNRELVAEISTGTHALETALTQLHGPKLDYLPVGVQESLTNTVNEMAPKLCAS